MFQDDGTEHADGDAGDAVPEALETVQVVPGSKLLWRVNSRPPNSAQVRVPLPQPLPTLASQCTSPEQTGLATCHLGGRAAGQASRTTAPQSHTQLACDTGSVVSCPHGSW